MAKRKKVKVDNKTYNINSPEYKKLYSEGIMSVDTEGIPNYYSPEEATVTAKRINRGEEAVRKGRGKFGAGVLSALDYAMQFGDTPTALALEVLTGRGDFNAALPNITRSLKKFKLPVDESLKPYETKNDQLSVSEALGIENPYLATTLDILSSRGVRRKSGKAVKNPKQFIKQLSTEGLPEEYANLNQAGFANLIGLDKAKQNFKSEIDWSKWNPETPNYPELINEYNTIEESTKKAGTWMKNPDGSKFQGTPEQFIQQQSSNFKKAFPEGFDQTFRGSDYHIPTLIVRPETNYKSLFTGNKDLANNYSTVTDKGYYNPNIPTFEQQYKSKGYKGGPLQNIYGKAQTGGVYNLAVPKTNNKIFLDAQNRHWADLQNDEIFNKLQNKGITSSSDTKNYNVWPRPSSNKSFSTDNLATYLDQSDDLKRVEIKNVNDGGLGDVLIHKHVPGNYAKSLIGNVGFFDMTNPNIYKGLAPGAIATGAALSQLPQEEKALGGKITNNMKKKKNKNLPIDNGLPKAMWGLEMLLPLLGNIGTGVGAASGAASGLAGAGGGGLGSLGAGAAGGLGTATGAGAGLQSLGSTAAGSVKGSANNTPKGMQSMNPLGPLANATTKAVTDMIKAIIEPEENYRTTLKNTGAHYANGGKINIKPSKRGTFTAAATKRGKGVQEFARQVLANKDNYSPAMVKKANFARNAAKWKKAMGGLVEPEIFEMGGLTRTYMDAFDAMALGGLTGGPGDPTLPPLKATASDSLNVYNSAINFENKMKNLGYEKTSNYNMFDAYSQFIDNNEFALNDGKLKVKTPNKRLANDVSLMGTAASRNLNKNVKDVGDFYSNKKVDDYKYDVAELLSQYGYNTDLPYQVLDERISPQGATRYTLNNALVGDAAVMLNYDPVAVKPYKMRTPEEHKEFKNKYGGESYGEPVTPVTDIRPDAKKFFKSYENLDQMNIDKDLYTKFLRSGVLTGEEATKLTPYQILQRAKSYKPKAMGGMIDPLMAFGGMIDPSMYMEQMMYGSYAGGGQVPQNIPVEVEGEEMYELPNGQTGEFQGPKHENGGIPIALPEGTKIYSDRLKVDGKTMAQRKEKRDNNIKKLEKLLTKNPSDRFIKEALQRQQETASLEEQGDMQMQEQANQQQAMQEQAMEQMLMGAAQQDIQQGMMAMGGMIKRADGSYSQRGLWDNIRANKGSGKRPTKEMLKQEKKIRAAEKAYGGLIQYAPGGFVNTDSPQVSKDIELFNKLNYIGDANKPFIRLAEDMPSSTQTETSQKTNKPGFDFSGIFGNFGGDNTSNSNVRYTEGDRMGMMGNLMGMYGPATMTMLNRLETPKNKNFFREFGQEALRTQMEAEGIAGMAKDEAYRKNLMRANALRNQLANSARGVSDMRTGQLTAALTEQEGGRDILGSYLQSMSGLKGQRAQLQQQIDQTRMGGEYQRDLADRQDIDQFYTNLAENLATASEFTQKQGKDMNTALRNKDIMSLSKYYSAYGIYADYDEKGNLVLKDDSTGKTMSVEEANKKKKKMDEEAKKEAGTTASTTPTTESK